MIDRLGPREEPHFFCSSEGNAGTSISSLEMIVMVGLAAASAARILGKKATICVTNNTPQPILDRLKAEGAEVRQYGYFWSDADDLCRQLVKSEPNGVCIPWRPSDYRYIVRHLIIWMLFRGTRHWCTNSRDKWNTRLMRLSHVSVAEDS